MAATDCGPQAGGVGPTLWEKLEKLEKLRGEKKKKKSACGASSGPRRRRRNLTLQKSELELMIISVQKMFSMATGTAPPPGGGGAGRCKNTTGFEPVAFGTGIRRSTAELCVPRFVSFSSVRGDSPLSPGPSQTPQSARKGPSENIDYTFSKKITDRRKMRIVLLR